VAGEAGQGHGDKAGALGWQGAGLRREHEAPDVLAIAEGANLHVFLRQAELVDREVAVAGRDGAVRLQARRLAEQLAVLKAAVSQAQHLDELPADVLDDIVRVPASCASVALVTMRVKYPASATVTAFRRRARAAIWDTATPTASSSANVVTSAE
jgi:hypothetical protein